MIAVPYTPIVVNTGTKLVVIDTGTGEANFERSKGAAGQFANNLKAAGIDRNQVDTVIISHFHGDHINGLLTADNKPAYPNAEILVPAAEWKYFMDDAEMGKQTTDRMKGVFTELAPRVRRARPQGDAVRAGQGSRAGHHLGCHLRSHAGPQLVHHRVRQRQGVRAVGRDEPAAVRAQSRLAPDVRPGRQHGGSDAPQGLRHAGEPSG